MCTKKTVLSEEEGKSFAKLDMSWVSEHQLMATKWMFGLEEGGTLNIPSIILKIWCFVVC